MHQSIQAMHYNFRSATLIEIKIFKKYIFSLNEILEPLFCLKEHYFLSMLILYPTVILGQIQAVCYHNIRAINASV